jgi:hypothetical protein
VIDHQPAAPNADHEWNAMRKRWVLSGAATARNATRAAALARMRKSSHHSIGPSGSLPATRAMDAIDDEISKLREVLA